MRTATDYGYNENGLPTSVAHTAQTSTYRYDPRDLVDQVTVTEPGAAAKVTEFGYWPRGLQQFERKANQNRVDYTYTLDGLLATQVERKPDSTLIAQHGIDYSPNGHRVRDASKLQNADNPSAYLDEIREYGYDPRDRIRTVTKKAAP